MNLDLSGTKKVFFIGIGGIGISALAKMAVSRGMEVSGVNDDESPKTLDPLREMGVEVFLKDELARTALPQNQGKGGPCPEIPEADLYVYSDAWLYRGPEIIEEAKKTGKPVLSYFEALGEFAKGYKVIAVSGTHGKTTTTAMVADILIDAGLDPTVIVGSFVKKFGSNFRAGNPSTGSGQGVNYLVVEADEYNKHLLNFYPYIGLVTNIEADHLDCYKDLEEIENTFKKFLSQCQNSILDYSKYLEKVPKLSVPGEHNKMNAAAAYAIADFFNIPEETIKKSLENFAGTWRRLEKRGETKEGTIIYDDYAHHPTEIRASLEALREIYPKGEKKITVVFQPHLYSRTKALFNDFAKSFKEADNIFILPIFFAREEKDESVSGEKLASAITLAGEKAKSFPDFQSAENFIKELTFGENDVFVTMGAGEAYKIADKIFKFS